MSTQARTATATELLRAFLHTNLHARDDDALAVFVEAAVTAVGSGDLDADAIRWLRHLWHQRTAPTAEAQRAYEATVFLPARIREVTALVGSAPKNMLDIGFGDGAVLRALAAHWQLAPSQVIGVETRYAPVVTPSGGPHVDRAARRRLAHPAARSLHRAGHDAQRPAPHDHTHGRSGSRRGRPPGGRTRPHPDPGTRRLVPAEATFLVQLERVFYEVIAEESATAIAESTYRSLAGWLIAIDRAGLQVVTSMQPPARATHLQVDILCRVPG